MTTTLPTLDRADLRLTTGRAIRSEWLKLTTLRSTWITAGALVLVLAALGILSAATVPAGAVTTPADSFPALLGGMGLAVLLVGALGALVGAREHASGMIRTTVAAVPGRTRVLLAKATALTLLLVPAVALGVGISAVVGSASLRAGGIPTLALTDPLALRALGGSVVYLVCVGLIGLAVGVLLRNVAGAVATVVGVVLLLPQILTALLPSSWADVLELLPSSAGQAMSAVTGSAVTLTPGAGLAVFLAWVVAALTAAALVLSRRDA
jgi:ABC-2 type transport system permease protein